MRPTRMTIVLLLMVGLLGAWLGVFAQDRRTPWPSPVASTSSEVVQALPINEESSTAQPPAMRSATPIGEVMHAEPASGSLPMPRAQPTPRAMPAAPFSSAVPIGEVIHTESVAGSLPKPRPQPSPLTMPAAPAPVGVVIHKGTAAGSLPAPNAQPHPVTTHAVPGSSALPIGVVIHTEPAAGSLPVPRAQPIAPTTSVASDSSAAPIGVVIHTESAAEAPREQPIARTAPAIVDDAVVQVSVPAKLPADLPSQPHKAAAQPPVASAEIPAVEKPTPPAATAPVPIPILTESSTKKQEAITVVQPALPESPEPLPPPRKADSKPISVPSQPPATDAPKKEPSQKDQTPPMLVDVPMPNQAVPPLPTFTKAPKPAVSPPNEPAVPPVPMLTDIPKLGAADSNPEASPAVPNVPKVELPAGKNATQPPASLIDTKPVAPSVPREPTTVTGPIIVPEAPPIPVLVPGPSPMNTPQIEAKSAAPERPPAFQIVRPRRVEAPPQPGPSAPALVDAPHATQIPLASSSAQVTVEKRGPSVLREGVTASYQIIVRNRGESASGPVTVIDEIPPHARQLGGIPAPQQLGDKALWTLPPLPPHGETVLSLELQATGGGEFVGKTTVYVSAATATTRAQIQRNLEAAPVSSGPLSVQLHGPAGGAVGQEVVFDVQVTNRGKQPMTDLVLHAKLGEGLTHPSGNQIEADVGDLAAGASKTFKMPATAVRSGRQTVEVKITAAGGIDARAQGFVLITGNGLSIQLAPTSRLMLDRDGDIRIDVTNLQAEGLRNVQIADTLPEDLRFVGASDRGIYQASTRRVQWLIDALPAGETRTLTLRVQGKKPGQFAQEVSAAADSLPATQVRSLVQVDGYANLNLKVTPREQPIGVGKETVCEVRIQNLGNLAASGVQLQVDLPAGLSSGYVQGPTAHRLQGRTLIFAPIAKLPAQTQAVYHLGVTARAAGDQRIRARIVTDQEPTPLVREAPVQVYRE